MRIAPVAALLLAFSLTVGCGGVHGEELVVTSSAYNSVGAQTDDNPTLAAWGDTLVPGMKSIAVSRDLIALGLGHEAEIEIEGLPGTYIVRDKMAKRWTKKIDIYMGEDVEAAREWGVRQVTIRWQPSPKAK